MDVSSASFFCGQGVPALHFRHDRGEQKKSDGYGLHESGSCSNADIPDREFFVIARRSPATGEVPVVAGEVAPVKYDGCQQDTSGQKGSCAHFCARF
jgi:hypothetical protein